MLSMWNFSVERSLLWSGGYGCILAGGAFFCLGVGVNGSIYWGNCQIASTPDRTEGAARPVIPWTPSIAFLIRENSNSTTESKGPA